MISVSALLPAKTNTHPAIVLVHGAANSALVWRFWQRDLAERGWPSYAIDLRGHGDSSPIDLSLTTMSEYAADVEGLLDQIRRPSVIIGWSMGGLVAQMAATSGTAAACVGLDPSPPALGVDGNLTLRTGVFDSEDYGIKHLDPDNQPVMPDLDIEERKIALASLGPESQHARDERKRGIVLKSMPCPLLIAIGDESTKIFDAEWFEADRLVIEGSSHWGLVLSRGVLRTLIPDVLEWIDGNI